MVQYTLTELSEFTKCKDRIKQTYSHIINTLVEHLNNKIFTSVLFILEDNTSIMGSMKNIIDKNFGKFPKAFGQIFEHI